MSIVAVTVTVIIIRVFMYLSNYIFIYIKKASVYTSI